MDDEQNEALSNLIMRTMSNAASYVIDTIKLENARRLASAAGCALGEIGSSYYETPTVDKYRQWRASGFSGMPLDAPHGYMSYNKSWRLTARNCTSKEAATGVKLRDGRKIDFKFPVMLFQPKDFIKILEKAENGDHAVTVSGSREG